jgi:nucleobase:cation symporter-1, NCS1 family
MDPVPPQQRTWSSWNYIAYWISDATNVAVWELASSMIAVGLSWCVCFIIGGRVNGLTRRSIQETGIACHRSWAYHYFGGHGFERNCRSAPARCIPGTKPVILWLLVQLLQCGQPSHPCAVLVWHTGMCRSFIDQRAKFNALFQTFTGSQCVYQMLKAIWPSTARIPNALGDGAHITTVGKCSDPSRP